jgi:hypothetical protein
MRPVPIILLQPVAPGELAKAAEDLRRRGVEAAMTARAANTAGEDAS